MHRDGGKLSQADNELLNMQVLSDCAHDVSMTGQITDRIFKNGVLIDTIEGHNLVVSSFLRLVMALCKGQQGYSGLQYWAVGSGAASWDSNQPEPEINASRLTAEIGRVAISAADITFLNADMSTSSVPTNILQIKHTFGPSDCNGKWREFGLFGGNATGSANTGVMVNKRHHGLITKTSEMSIERTMRFTLNLA